MLEWIRRCLPDAPGQAQASASGAAAQHTVAARAGADAPQVGLAQRRPSDQPISSLSHDRFRRGKFSLAVAAHIRRLPPGESHVVALLGEWGSGKTSVINMVAEALPPADFAIVRFNPWMFAGTEQLTTAFFAELAAQLRESADQVLRDLGETLERYAVLLAPLKAIPKVGELLAAMAELMRKGGAYASRKGGVPAGSASSQRLQIEAALKKAKRRVLVIMDDLDRVPHDEIPEVMRLVRLCADFPNVTYLLALDHQRVASAIEKIGGADFLEKVLQHTFHIPVISEDDFARFVSEELDAALAEMRLDATPRETWMQVLGYVVRPLLRTPRDVRRFVSGIPFALDLAGEELAAVDVVALEAVRTALPQVFQELPRYENVLTDVSSHISQYGGDPLQPLFDLAGPRAAAAVRELCIALFPASRRFIDSHHYGAQEQREWRRQGRVAHPELFRTYFETALPGNVLPKSRIKEVLETLGSGERLGELLRALPADDLEALLIRLADELAEVSPVNVLECLPVFLSESLRLREGRRGMGDDGSDMAAERLVSGLLRRLPEGNERSIAFGTIFDGVPSLSRKLLLLTAASPPGDRAVPPLAPEVARPLKERLLAEFKASSAEELAQERDLLGLTDWAVGQSDPPDELLVLVRGHADRHPAFIGRLLASGLRETFSVTAEDYAARVEHVLPWDDLCALLTPDRLKAGVRSLQEAGGDGARLRAPERASRSSRRRNRPERIDRIWSI